VEETVCVAAQNGTRRLVHFALWRMTWHTQ
jgi:hypothetical protein